MRKYFSLLHRIDNNHEITKEHDPEFWFFLQYALLTALREQGLLGVMQYRYAADQLKKQQRMRQKSQPE